MAPCPLQLFLNGNLSHPRLQGVTIFTGVFKEAATKGSGKLRCEKGRGQDSEENSRPWWVQAVRKMRKISVYLTFFDERLADGKQYSKCF